MEGGSEEVHIGERSGGRGGKGGREGGRKGRREVREGRNPGVDERDGVPSFTERRRMEALELGSSTVKYLPSSHCQYIALSARGGWRKCGEAEGRTFNGSDGLSGAALRT